MKPQCVGCAGPVADRHKTICPDCWPALPKRLQQAVMRRRRLTPQQNIDVLIDVEAALSGRRRARRTR